MWLFVLNATWSVGVAVTEIVSSATTARMTAVRRSKIALYAQRKAPARRPALAWNAVRCGYVAGLFDGGFCAGWPTGVGTSGAAPEPGAIVIRSPIGSSWFSFSFM